MEGEESQVAHSLPENREGNSSNAPSDVLEGKESVEYDAEEWGVAEVAGDEEKEENPAITSNSDLKNNGQANRDDEKVAFALSIEEKENAVVDAISDGAISAQEEPASEEVEGGERDEKISIEGRRESNLGSIQDPVIAEEKRLSLLDEVPKEELSISPETVTESVAIAAEEENISSHTEHLSSEIPLKSGREEDGKDAQERLSNERPEDIPDAQSDSSNALKGPTSDAAGNAAEVSGNSNSGAGNAPKAPVEAPSRVAKTLVPTAPPPRTITSEPPTVAPEAMAGGDAPPPTAPVAQPVSVPVRNNPSVRQDSLMKSRGAHDSPSMVRSSRIAASRLPVQEVEHPQEDYYSLSQRSGSPGLGGQMLPAVFRRGDDNSHINRMTQGSYSRYLMSCGGIPLNSFVRSFFGELPIPGFLPFRGEHSAGAPSQYPVKSPRLQSSSSRRERNNQPGRYPGDTLSTAVTGALPGAMRREAAMLPENYHNELRAQRVRRKRDPQHGVDPTLTDQHYYQQKSKAFYVPQEQNPNAPMLQYNHIYDFGDGTRFKSNGTPVRNPTALPPKTYGKHRAATAVSPYPSADRASEKLYEGRGDPAQRGSSSSLRTAKAVDPQNLHTSQFRQTRSIEDVIASDPNFVARSAAGVRSAVASGKMDWSELPNRLQGVMSTERSRNAPSQNFQQRSTSEGDGTALPSIPQRQQAQQQQRAAGGDGQYEVSRVNFTKRYEPHATPSAFVGK